jgi:hypothetical protein
LQVKVKESNECAMPFCHRAARCPLTVLLCQFRLELPHGDRQQSCTMTPNSCQTMANLMRFLLFADRGTKKAAFP